MKFAIVLCLTFCLLAVHAQETTEKVPEKEKGLAQKIIEGTLAKIQAVFDSSMTTAQGLVEKIFEIINGVTTSIKCDIDKIKKGIQDMCAKGEKYMKCAEEQKPALKEIEDKTNAEIAACRQVADDKIKTVVDDLKTQATDAQKEVGQVVAKCFEDHPFISLICASKEASKSYAKAIINMASSIAASKLVIAEVSKEAQKCVKEAQDSSKSQYTKVLKDIQACADAA